MKNRLIGGIILLFLSGIYLLIAVPRETKDNPEDYAIVGTNAEFPPFAFVENEKIVGFEIDLAREVCQRLGKKMKIKDLPFDALLPEVILGQVDFVAAGMSYTEERAKRVLFTNSYLSNDPLVIVSLSEELKTIDDLTGKDVAVNEGYTADLFLSKREDINLIRLGSQPADGFLSLKSQRCDAFVTAENTLKPFLRKAKIENCYFSPIEGSNESCAIIVPKNYKRLRNKIQSCLDSMEEDGSLEEMRVHWGLS
jgi:arginine/lysine/histidine transporter system substrate-binding protein